MAISQDYIAELSRRTDITELVRGYVELKRAGRMEKGLCPFHNEKTPSFYVYPETSSFYCFGCGAGGDAITFVKNIANLDYVEAVKFLAARAGMPMPDEDDTAAKQRSRVLALNRESAKYFVKMLNTEDGAAARAYLRGRKLSDKTIRQFGIGYAPNSWDAMRDYLKGLGFSEDELVAADICRKSDRGGLYPTFRDRIMFPIIDLRGSVVAFSGRRMGDGYGGKYINSSDTPVFKKSRNVFALSFARKSGDRRLILCEGQMDVISLHQAGFPTAVAMLGTAFTDEQARLLADYADEVVICYDGDEAGQKATQRAIAVLRKTDVKVRVLTLSEAALPGDDVKDPDEFVQKYGAARFEELLRGSGNTIEYELDKAKKGFDLTAPDGRAAYIRAALNVLAAHASPAEQDIYAGRIAEETDVAKAAVLTQLEGVVKQRQRRWAKERDKRLKEEGYAAGIDRPYSKGDAALGVVFAEQQLVAAVLKDPGEYLPLAAQHVRPQQMLSSEMAEAYTLLLQKGEAGDHIDLSALSGELPEKTLALLGRVLALNYDTGFSRHDVMLFIERICEQAAQSADVAAMDDDAFASHIRNMQRQKGKKEEDAAKDQSG